MALRQPGSAYLICIANYIRMKPNPNSPSHPDLVQDVMQDLRKLVRALEGYSRSAEQRFGLTGPQLWALWELGREDALSLKALAARMRLSSSTLVGVIDRLVDKGYVTRVQDPEDRRRVCLGLTVKGKRLRLGAPDPAQGRMIEGFDRLSTQDLRAFRRYLGVLLAAMEADQIEARFFFSED